MTIWSSTAKRFVRAQALVLLALLLFSARPSVAADQVYFSAVDDVAAQLVQRINAETVRIDMSAWYLTDSTVYSALLNRFKAGVPVRLIGDRGSIFEIDINTKNTFYYLASQGLPIRLRYNPTWYPEIDHWKATIFAGQNLVAFGSANYTPFELTPFSSTNYKDEVTLFTSDPAIVGGFKTKFDKYWHDTDPEPESLIPSAPYFKNWDDACATESACSDYRTQYPNRVPMVINTARLEPDNPLPPEMVWGQGSVFNNRLVGEINKESTAIDFVIYRLTVPNITNALLQRKAAGVPMRLIVEPDEYLNRKWPEFWITHANVDSLWAAGVPMKMRTHTGLTHMKVLITSTLATIASSNYAAAWQRDHNYFMPATAKPAIYTAIKNRFQAMWNDTSGFADFRPQGPDSPTPESPSSGASGVSTTPTLTWARAVFATNYDVYLGTSPNSMSVVGNVQAQLVNDPPPTYSFTPPNQLAGNTTYYWKVVSRTNATPRDPNMVASSSLQTFTTTSGGSNPPPGGGTVPSPWLTQDVGSVGAAGNASYANGVFTVSGAGADIWGSSDGFRYVFQGVSGDTDIIARVASVQNTNTYAKAGVMLRESLSASAAHVILDVRPDGTVEFMTRSSAGGATSWLAGATQGFPAWLKLSRSGNTVTGSVSSNGSTWTAIGSTTTSMAASANLGLLVTSHNTGALNTSTFDNVSVNAGSTPPPPPGVPLPWTSADVGSTGIAGSASVANGTFTVSGAGADVWGNADAFQYVSQPTSGDTQIVARVTAIQNTNTYAKAGVMLRDSLSAGGAHVILDTRPDGSIEFMTRSSAGGATSYLAGATQPAPAWLRLSRTGSTVTASVSANGSTWTTVGSVTTSIPASARVGLVVTSHDVNTLNTSTFDNVAVGTPSSPPPPTPTPTATNVVIYATDIAAASLHGNWTKASDPTSPGSVKLVTPDNGVANANNPLASPTNYVDVSFNADANVPYTLWLRLKATANSKFNDAVWVQFSDALSGGTPVYPINSPTGLLVNLATDSTASSLNNWGWQNTAYWLSQATTVTFASTGAHTLRIQIREDGVQLDQIVLSPTTYLSSSPGSVTNDSTIVPK